MKRARIAALALSVVFAAACDKEEKPKEGASAESVVEAAVDAAIDEAEAEVGKVFDKKMRKKACEFLTPAMVSEMFDVPESNLRQHKIMGCIYSLKKSEDQNLEVRVTTIMVHSSVDRAKTWFKNSTKNLTEEEAKKQMEMVMKKTKEHKSIDTDVKKKTVDKVGGLLSQSVQGGVKYEPLEGIGDDAAFSLSDGAIWVRTGNMTYVVAGYKGPKQPQPDLTGLTIKQMTGAAMKAQKEWIQKTMPARKAGATKVAKALAEAFAK